MDQKINYNREDLLDSIAAMDKALSGGVPIEEIVIALGNLIMKRHLLEVFDNMEEAEHDNV